MKVIVRYKFTKNVFRHNARQRHGKHVSAVTNNHATTEDLLEAVFSMLSVPWLYEDNQLEFLVAVENVRELSWVSCGSRQPARIGAVEHGS
jgi:hypothetical protein